MVLFFIPGPTNNNEITFFHCVTDATWGNCNTSTPEAFELVWCITARRRCDVTVTRGDSAAATQHRERHAAHSSADTSQSWFKEMEDNKRKVKYWRKETNPAIRLLPLCHLQVSLHISGEIYTSFLKAHASILFSCATFRKKTTYWADMSHDCRQYSSSAISKILFSCFVPHAIHWSTPILSSSSVSHNKSLLSRTASHTHTGSFLTALRCACLVLYYTKPCDHSHTHTFLKLSRGLLSYLLSLRKWKRMFFLLSDLVYTPQILICIVWEDTDLWH